MVKEAYNIIITFLESLNRKDDYGLESQRNSPLAYQAPLADSSNDLQWVVSKLCAQCRPKVESFLGKKAADAPPYEESHNESQFNSNRESFYVLESSGLPTQNAKASVFKNLESEFVIVQDDNCGPASERSPLHSLQNIKSINSIEECSEVSKKVIEEPFTLMKNPRSDVLTPQFSEKLESQNQSLCNNDSQHGLTKIETVQ